MTYDEFNEFYNSFPAATYVLQWRNTHVWKVGGSLQYYIEESYRIVSLRLTKKLQKQLSLNQ